MITEIVQDIGYGFIPRSIMRNKNLSLQAKAIYSYLASFAGNTGKAFPSVSLMLSELKLSKDTYYKYIDELKESGAIQVKQERSNGVFGRNIYYLNNEVKSPCPNSSDTGTSDTVSSDTKNWDSNSNNLNSNNLNSNKKEIDAHFEKVWSLYPSKKGKGTISNTKKKEIYKLGEEFERCISRYVNYVKAERKKGFQELKYQNGSTFFNSGYIDYLDKNVKEKTTKPKKPYAPNLVYFDI